MKNSLGKLQVFLGVIGICLTVYLLYLNSFLEWTPSNIRHFGIVTVTFFSIVVVAGLAFTWHRVAIKKTVASEFKWHLKQLAGQRRRTRKERASFFREGQIFISTLQKYILPVNYELELEALLEAQNELTEQKNYYYSESAKRLKRNRKEEERPKLDITIIEEDLRLTELALTELNNKVLLIADEGRFGKDNKLEFRQLIQQKQQVYEENHQRCTQYFRELELILRLLNRSLDQGKITLEDYDTALATLRNEFSHEELLLVLIYSVFIPEGCGLGVELVGTKFFGNELEIFSQSYLSVPELLSEFIVKEFSNNGRRRGILKQQLIGRNQLAHQVKVDTEFSKTKRAKIYQILAENVEGFVNLDKLSYFSLVDYFDLYR